MTTTVFGFGAPLDFNSVEKGMLAFAQPSEGQRYFGVIGKIRSDLVLIVIAASGSEAPPYVINVSALHNNMWRVPGDLEIEPRDGNFAYPPIDTPHSNGLVMDADGRLFAIVMQRDPWNSVERYIFDIATGEHADGEASAQPKRPFAAVSDPAMYIRQEGRKDRYAVDGLTPDS